MRQRPFLTAHVVAHKTAFPALALIPNRSSNCPNRTVTCREVPFCTDRENSADHFRSTLLHIVPTSDEHAAQSACRLDFSRIGTADSGFSGSANWIVTACHAIHRCLVFGFQPPKK